MELYEEVLSQVLAEHLLTYVKDFKWLPLQNTVEERCYEALVKIRDAVRDDSLDDEECLVRIDVIICALEEIGIRTGSRHDFG